MNATLVWDREQHHFVTSIQVHTHTDTLLLTLCFSLLSSLFLHRNRSLDQVRLLLETLDNCGCETL